MTAGSGRWQPCDDAKVKVSVDSSWKSKCIYTVRDCRNFCNVHRWRHDSDRSSGREVAQGCYAVWGRAPMHRTAPLPSHCASAMLCCASCRCPPLRIFNLAMPHRAKRSMRESRIARLQQAENICFKTFTEPAGPNIVAKKPVHPGMCYSSVLLYVMCSCLVVHLLIVVVLFISTSLLYVRLSFVHPSSDISLHREWFHFFTVFTKCWGLLSSTVHITFHSTHACSVNS